MANILLSTPGQILLSDVTGLDSSDNYNVSHADEIHILAGVELIVDKNLTCKRIVLKGGNTEAGRAILTVGNAGIGRSITTTTDSNWGQFGGSISTNAYSTINAEFCTFYSRGGSPFVGSYNASYDQTNVRMNFTDCVFFNQNEDYTALRASEPMLSPNILAVRVSFYGISTCWVNGDLDPASENLRIRSVDTANPKGFGCASAQVTGAKVSTDGMVIQQSVAANPSYIRATDFEITTRISTNASGAGRYFEFGRTFQPSLSGTTEQYRFYIENNIRTELFNDYIAVDEDREIPLYWVKIANTANNTASIPIEDVPTLVTNNTWTVENQLPFILRARRVGFEAQEYTYTADDVDFQGNQALAPVLMGSPQTVDEAYKFTDPAIEVVNTVDELYDLVKQAQEGFMALPTEIFEAVGAAREIRTGMSLIKDQTLATPIKLVVDGFDILGNYSENADGTPVSELRVKTGEDGLARTDQADTLIGTVDQSFWTSTDMNFTRGGGLVGFKLEVTLDEGVTSPVWGIWLASQGIDDRSNMETAPASVSFTVTAGESYYYLIDAINLKRYEPKILEISDVGNTLNFHLKSIRKSNNAPLIPLTLNEEEQMIADTLDFRIDPGHIKITLPADYATNSRWNEEAKVWTYTEDDFYPLCNAIEIIQSSEHAITAFSTMNFEDKTMSIPTESNFVFAQAEGNVDCKINMNAWTIHREGDPDSLQTFINETWGGISITSKIPVFLVTPQNVYDDVVGSISAKVEEADTIKRLKSMTDTTLAELDGNGNPLPLLDADGNAVFDAGNNPVMQSDISKFGSVALENTPFVEDLEGKATLVKMASMISTTPETLDGNGDVLEAEINEFNEGALQNAPTADAYGGLSATDLNNISNSLLDTPHGQRAGAETIQDSTLLRGSLGEHWNFFRPAQVVRDLLESQLDGTTLPTPFTPQEGTYGEGSYGQAIIDKSTKEEVEALGAMVEGRNE